MTNIPLPIEVLYAGLGGTVLALIVATIQQRWSLRVFFLLALRLAIGWHFLFEGLYKVNTDFVGPTETNRVFTSEPYFRVAPGPIGPYMRRQFGDTLGEIDRKVKASKKITPAEFDKLSAAEQAAECPAAVAEQLDKLEEQAGAAVTALKAEGEKEVAAAKPAEEKALKKIDETLAGDLKTADTPLEKKQAEDVARDAREEAKKKAAAAVRAGQEKTRRYADGKEFLTAAKATYARWVYGAEGRPATMKDIKGDVVLTAPERLDHLAWLRREVAAGEARQAPGLGSGYGTDAKRLAEFRTELIKGEIDLLKDADAFTAELAKALNGGKDVEKPKATTRGQTLDKVTMWFLVGVGACLMLGLLTRLACLMAAGFLVTTYLLHPPFPWFPQPPGTEGNPVFVNKNAIEFLALMVLACYPTGRWLGIDALLGRIFLGPAPREN